MKEPYIRLFEKEGYAEIFDGEKVYFKLISSLGRKKWKVVHSKGVIPMVEQGFSQEYLDERMATDDEYD